MTILSKVAQTTSVAALALWFHGCKDDKNDKTEPTCAKMTSDCQANATKPPTDGKACCQYFGAQPDIPPPGELGLVFPGADLKLSYFEIPACSAFQFHFHNHPEGLIMLEGELVNPFVNGAMRFNGFNTTTDTTSPILAGSTMTVNEAQILPQGGGHTYVCTSTTGSCRWMSLWPNVDFSTSFMFPPQTEGEFSADHRGEGKWANDGPPIITGNVTDSKCNLQSAVTDKTIVADALAGFTLSAAEGADPEVCFEAPNGKNDQYSATMINDFQKKTSLKTDGGCAYGVLEGEVTWCLTDDNCSDMPAFTFFYAGKDGGSTLKPKSSSTKTTLYKACNSKCTDNNPWKSLAGTYNLDTTKGASADPFFTRVVTDICKNPAFATAEYVKNCPAV